jgi:cytochrome c'
MRRMRLLGISLVGVGLIGLMGMGTSSQVRAEEQKAIGHEGVEEPTRALMDAMSKRMTNMLEGILAGNLKYVSQEAGSVVDQSYTINKTFFPLDPKDNKWFKKAKIDPGDKENITKLKESFDTYQKGIATSALEIQKAAKANNQDETFKSFVSMVQKTCFECHKENRDKQVPIENR